MARIVFAGELGGSRGELRRSLAIAEQWRAQGHDVSFVVADVIAANSLLPSRGIPFVAAPLLARRPLRSHHPANHRNRPAALGYEDRDSLLARVRAWLKLFELAAADAVVIDRAPTAQLATKVSQRRTLLLEPDSTPAADPSSDATVTANIEAVMHALSGLRDSPRGSYSNSPKSAARRRIVYAWELGANAGHLERGATIAESLRERGHEVIFAVSDLRLAERLLAPHGFEFVPVPSTPLPARRQPVINFSDLLLTCGFDDPVALDARVRAWTHLLRYSQADTIVIDHAPTAQLAAHILVLPTVLVGSGFAIPPVTQPFPSIQPQLQIAVQQLALADHRALAPVNAVLRRFDARPLTHLSDLFARSTPIITSFPELDAYRERGAGIHVGPVYRAVHARSQWRTSGRIRVLAYMRPHIAGVDALAQTLRSYDAEVKLVMPGASPAFVSRYRTTHFEIFTELIELDSLLKEADVVVGYGGAGVLARALLAGVPLLLLSDVLEQVINSTRVVELGAGILLLEHRDVSSIRAALSALISERRYRTAARNFAAKYRDRDGAAGACERIVAAIEGAG